MVETECKWCGEPLFITDSEEHIVYSDGRTKLVTAEGLCPKCQRKNVVIKSIDINFISNLTIRHGGDIDRIVGVFFNINGNNLKIDEMCTDLKNRLENLVPNDLEKKPKKIVLKVDDETIEDSNTLEEYIRNNYDESDLREWIDDEFGEVEIGPMTYSASDIVDEMGDFNTVANETFCCDYAHDRVCSADMESLGDLTTEDCDLKKDQEINIAGLTFTVAFKDDDPVVITFEDSEKNE